MNANHLMKITSSRALVHGMNSTYMSPLNWQISTASKANIQLEACD